MKLYLLKRKGDAGYDETAGVLIRALDARTARELAASQHGDEGPWVWHNPTQTSCRQVKPEGPEAIIITDFHAG